MNKKILLACILSFVTMFLYAQKEQNGGIMKSALWGLQYEVKAGFSIGGTAPVPLPVEIRALESYNPTIAIAIEGNATKWFTPIWGLQVGLRLENKGMKTNARVKNYNLEMIANDGGQMQGAWTGYVRTKVHNSYLTIPVLATYKLNPRFCFNGGLFAAYMMEGEFSGSAYDGYLRNGDPTGDKVYVTEATYDFSKDLRRFSWGAQLGAEWRAFKHLNVYADLTWGFNDIFPKDFDTVTFDMYPIYLNVGFGYAF